MPDRKVLKKELVNARLLKNYGGWIYCGSCGITTGYLCYSTYDYFRFRFQCNCGEHGSVEIGEAGRREARLEKENLITRKGRLCCPHDESPLFSVVNKNLKEYDFIVKCSNCKHIFEENKS